MRRSLVAAVALATMASLGMAQPATAEDNTRPELPQLPEQASDRAQVALATVERIFEGKARPSDPDATLALRDLWLTRSALSGRDAEAADAVLARPTNPTSFESWYGVVYTTKPKKKCNTKVCVHWEEDTTHAPPNVEWVNTTLQQVTKAYNKITKKSQMGYRRPPADGFYKPNGGNKKFDVYLANLYDAGLYGYCSAEAYAPRSRKRATSYCVLDSDFVGFPTSPLDSLRVTAAHEFFHSVQFGYDVHEKPWVMENTATWMEERFADEVNDNYQYLPSSQLVQPGWSLTKFDKDGVPQYANWIFWEYFTQRQGNGVVKKFWNKAPKTTATKAMRAAVGKKKWNQKFRSYSANLGTPWLGWEEGGAMYTYLINHPLADPYSPPGATLSAAAPEGRLVRGRVTKLASKSMQFVPAGDLTNHKLRINVNFVKKSAGGAAIATIFKADGTVARKPVKLNKKGKGKVVVGFTYGNVRRVVVTLVNAHLGKNKRGGFKVKAIAG